MNLEVNVDLIIEYLRGDSTFADPIYYAIIHGADVHYEEEKALFLSALIYNINLMEFLLDHGADINVNNGEFIEIFCDNYRGTENTVILLLEHGADKNYITDDFMRRFNLNDIIEDDNMTSQDIANILKRRVPYYREPRN